MNKLGKEHFYIEKYKTAPIVKHVEDWKKIEGEWMRTLATFNGYVAGRTNKEWCNDNKEHVSEVKKKLYEKNKEQILRDKKQYYQDNNDEMRQRFKKPFECECGSVFQHAEKARHSKSKRHQAYEQQNNNSLINNINNVSSSQEKIRNKK